MEFQGVREGLIAEEGGKQVCPGGGSQSCSELATFRFSGLLDCLELTLVKSAPRSMADLTR